MSSLGLHDNIHSLRISNVQTVHGLKIESRSLRGDFQQSKMQRCVHFENYVIILDVDDLVRFADQAL